MPPQSTRACEPHLRELFATGSIWCDSACHICGSSKLTQQPASLVCTIGEKWLCDVRCCLRWTCNQCQHQGTFQGTQYNVVNVDSRVLVSTHMLESMLQYMALHGSTMFGYWREKLHDLCLLAVESNAPQLQYARDMIGSNVKSDYAKLYNKCLHLRAAVRTGLYGYLALRRSAASEWFKCSCAGGLPEVVVVDGNSVGYH